MSGDEDPSGLRDALVEAFDATKVSSDIHPVDVAYGAVSAWLSVVSEGQRSVLRELTDAADDGVSDCVDGAAALRLNAAIRASREVLIDRSSSGE